MLIPKRWLVDVAAEYQLAVIRRKTVTFIKRRTRRFKCAHVTYNGCVVHKLKVGQLNGPQAGAFITVCKVRGFLPVCPCQVSTIGRNTRTNNTVVIIVWYINYFKSFASVFFYQPYIAVGAKTR